MLKLSDEMMAWLSYWSEVQITMIQFLQADALPDAQPTVSVTRLLAKEAGGSDRWHRVGLSWCEAWGPDE